MREKWELDALRFINKLNEKNELVEIKFFFLNGESAFGLLQSPDIENGNITITGATAPPQTPDEEKDGEWYWEMNIPITQVSHYQFWSKP